MGWGLTETDSIVAHNKAEVGKGLGFVGLGWGLTETDSIVAHNKGEVGKGLGFVGLGWGLADLQHRRPQPGRGRQGSGVCWTGLESLRQTYTCTVALNKAEVGKGLGFVGLGWVGVSQIDSVVSLNKAEVGKGLGFVGLGWGLTDRPTAQGRGR